MQAKHFCKYTATTAASNTRIATAARIMTAGGTRSMVVTRPDRPHGQPLGVVSDRDLLIRMLDSADSGRSETLGDIVCGTENTLTVAESDDLWDIVARMGQANARWLAVTDQNGDWAGVICLEEILTWFAEAMPQLRGLLDADSGARTGADVGPAGEAGA